MRAVRRKRFDVVTGAVDSLANDIRDARLVSTANTLTPSCLPLNPTIRRNFAEKYDEKHRQQTKTAILRQKQRYRQDISCEKLISGQRTSAGACLCVALVACSFQSIPEAVIASRYHSRGWGKAEKAQKSTRDVLLCVLLCAGEASRHLSRRTNTAFWTTRTPRYDTKLR